MNILLSIFLVVFVSGKQLPDSMEESISECRSFMERNLDCFPPSSKINKYTFRIRKAFRGMMGQAIEGKCPTQKKGSKNGRKRRSGRGDQAEQNQERISTEREKSFDYFFIPKDCVGLVKMKFYFFRNKITSYLVHIRCSLHKQYANPKTQTDSEGLLGRRMEPMFTSDGEMMNPLMNRILDFNGGFSDEDFMEATIAEAEIDGR